MAAPGGWCCFFERYHPCRRAHIWQRNPSLAGVASVMPAFFVTVGDRGIACGPGGPPPGAGNNFEANASCTMSAALGAETSRCNHPKTCMDSRRGNTRLFLRVDLRCSERSRAMVDLERGSRSFRERVYRGLFTTGTEANPVASTEPFTARVVLRSLGFHRHFRTGRGDGSVRPWTGRTPTAIVKRHGSQSAGAGGYPRHG